MIDTKDIRVDYGDVTAVIDVSISIPAGEVFGLIGPNGAGKTSLIRVLATLREPTYGDIKIAGINTLDDIAGVRRSLGYMPDMAPVYKDLKCWEFLDLFARSYFVSRKQRRARIEECIELVSLDTKRGALAGTLSRGMTQRLVLAKTLLHDPAVLLLDEPASGLDPIARIDLRNLLIRLGDQGKTVLISSHILNELSEFCTSIGIMEKGKMVVSGDIEEIVADLSPHRRCVIETIGPSEALAETLRLRDDVVSVESSNGTCEIELTATDDELALLLAEIVRGSTPIKGFYERRRGVEDVVMRVGASEVS